MTTVKTRLGMLYERCDAETCKLVTAEITNRRPDIEILADIVADKNEGTLMFHVTIAVVCTLA